MEIERKWLVNGFPEGYRARKERTVVQSYPFVSPDFEIRLKASTKHVGTVVAPTHHKITMKKGNGLSRTELETEIEWADYNALRMFTDPAFDIHKDYRTYNLNNGLELQVSEVDGWWYYAEIEFPSIEAARAFDPSDIAILREGEEVTGDEYWAMKNYYLRKMEGKFDAP